MLVPIHPLKATNNATATYTCNTNNGTRIAATLARWKGKEVNLFNHYLRLTLLQVAVEWDRGRRSSWFWLGAACSVDGRIREVMSRTFRVEWLRTAACAAVMFTCKWNHKKMTIMISKLSDFNIFLFQPPPPPLLPDTAILLLNIAAHVSKPPLGVLNGHFFSLSNTKRMIECECPVTKLPKSFINSSITLEKLHSQLNFNGEQGTYSSWPHLRNVSHHASPQHRLALAVIFALKTTRYMHILLLVQNRFYCKSRWWYLDCQPPTVTQMYNKHGLSIKVVA